MSDADMTGQATRLLLAKVAAIGDLEKVPGVVAEVERLQREVQEAIVQALRLDGLQVVRDLALADPDLPGDFHWTLLYEALTLLARLSGVSDDDDGEGEP